MTPKQHIVFITREIIPYYYGGIGTLFKAQAKLLLQAGHSVSFITRSFDGLDVKEIKRNYGDVGVYTVDVPEPSSYVDYSPSGGVISTYNLAYAIAVAKKYQAIEHELQPDIVISAEFGAEALFVLLQSSLMGSYSGTRFVLHISGGTYDAISTYESNKPDGQLSELNELQNQLNVAMEDCCIFLAGEIVAPTEIAWKETSSRLQIIRNIEVVPNLLDKDLFCQNKEQLVEDENYILFVGRLDRHKGADLLLQFFLEWQSKLDPDMKLILVGRDCFWKEYDMTFLEFWQEKIPVDLKNKIVFTGQIEHTQVKEYLVRASLCVFPSRWEVFGIVCLEAMSYGAPTVVSKDTGLAEVLGDGLRDFALDFHTDQEKLCAIIRSVVDRAGSRRTELRKTIRQRYEHIVDRSERDFVAVIESPKKIEHVDDEIPKLRIFNRLFKAVSAVSDISHILSNDVLKMRNYLGVSDSDYCGIIRGEFVASKGVWSSICSWMKKKMYAK